MIKIKTRIILCILAMNSWMHCNAQQQDETDTDQAEAPKKTKILTGLFVGAYFANKYTASAYNGYGFDINGNQNTFLNSFMYQKIKNEYGGGYGQTDYVAEALGVDPKQWEFNESDMPVNMRYVPAIMVGLNFKIPVKKRTNLILNFNAAKLTVEGQFTMTLLRPPGTNPGINNNLKTFPIRGSEQRLLFQTGIQQIFGEDEKFNFFAECGFNGTLAKFDKNNIYINNLQIDLTYYVNQAIFPAPGPTRKPVGFGLGAFAGLGTNFEMNPGFTLQFLYSLSHERIKIVTNTASKLQHSVGMRLYYKI